MSIKNWKVQGKRDETRAKPSGMIKGKRDIAGRKIAILMLSLLLLFTLSSCSSPKNKELSQPVCHEQQLEEENRKLHLEVKKLQRELLRKQGEINKLALSQQHTTREVVRTKAKLRSHSSKAETVANIAEVKTMLKAFSGKEVDEQLQQAVYETEQVIAESVAALNRGDVGKAFNLSNKAQQLVQPFRTVQGKNPINNGSNIVLVAPVMMKATKTCNVRTGPGMQYDARFTLVSGTQITALSYVKNWIQVESRKNGKGWVYYELLEIVP